MSVSTKVSIIIVAILATACSADRVPGPLTPMSASAVNAFARSDWSDPVGVGFGISPALSPDGLSLYFTSDRPGGVGGFDIWVARRDSECSPFGNAVNLGGIINSTEREQGAFISHEGHLLFFMRGNAGLTAGDIYVSRRTDVHDDFAWGPPVLLGAGVNTSQLETEPWFVRAGADADDDDVGLLYFGRGVNNNSQDFYVARIRTNGEAIGDAVPVIELNSGGRPPVGNEDGIAVRKDGREVVFASRRFATGAAELFVSTRRSLNDPWDPPQLLTTINSDRPDLHPALSDDGRTLVFSSARTGNFRLYTSTRSPSGKDKTSCRD